MSSFNFVSFTNWYRLLHRYFFSELKFDLHYISSILDESPYYKISSDQTTVNQSQHSIMFFDQEPIHPELIHYVRSAADWYFTPGQRFFVSSEKSTTVDRYTQGMNATSIYYFFHAIAANEWYHQYRWNKPVYKTHDHLYISYNNLVNPYRAHRIDLLCRLSDKNLLDQGMVSFNSPGQKYLSKIVDDCDWYTDESRAIFLKQTQQLTNRTIDTESIEGSLSATVDLEYSQKAMLQVVTETDFYKNKLHLTEKIFKPIVTGQPFMLLAGPGNLAYLREYGFKTFNDYWDESYDNISDHGKRVGAVVTQLERLSQLSHAQQKSIRHDMQDVIEHNFNHLFFSLRPMVVAELTDNIAKALKSQDIKFSTKNLRELYRQLVN